MPAISEFYGIVITMYFRQSEHNPPHLHARYGEYVASIDIKTMQVLDGKLPNKALMLVMEWMAMHQEELMKIWDTQEFNRIEPLE